MWEGPLRRDRLLFLSHLVGAQRPLPHWKSSAGIRPARVQLRGFAQMNLRFFFAPCSAKRVGQEGVAGRVPAIELEGFLKTRDGFVELTASKENRSQVRVRGGDPGLQLQS